MELDLGPFTFEYSTKVKQLDVIFQPFSMLDFDETVHFDLAKQDWMARTHSSLMPGWQDVLTRLKVNVKPNSTTIFKDLFDKERKAHDCAPQLMLIEESLALPAGPRYVNPEAKAYFIQKFENEIAYDTTLFIPLPQPHGKWTLEGVLLVIDPETKATMGMLVTNGICTSTDTSWFPAVLPEVDTCISMTAQDIIATKHNEGKGIEDVLIRDIALKMDTLVIPPMFNVEGIPYVWVNERMVNYYTKEVVANPIIVNRNILSFPSAQKTNVVEALSFCPAPLFMRGPKFVDGNSVSTLHFDIVFDHKDPLVMMQEINQFMHNVCNRALMASFGMNQSIKQNDHYIWTTTDNNMLPRNGYDNQGRPITITTGGSTTTLYSPYVTSSGVITNSSDGTLVGRTVTHNGNNYTISSAVINNDHSHTPSNRYRVEYTDNAQVRQVP